MASYWRQEEKLGAHARKSETSFHLMLSLSDFPVRWETGSFAEMGVGQRRVSSEAVKIGRGERESLGIGHKTD